MCYMQLHYYMMGGAKEKVAGRTEEVISSGYSAGENN